MEGNRKNQIENSKGGLCPSTLLYDWHQVRH